MRLENVDWNIIHDKYYFRSNVFIRTGNRNTMDYFYYVVFLWCHHMIIFFYKGEVVFVADSILGYNHCRTI